MTKHQVYVIWSNPIFRDAMRMVLTHPDVEWMGSELNFGQSLIQIASLEVDTIIVEITETHTIAEVIKALENDQTRLQIVGVSMDTNTVTRYRRDHICVIHEEELLDLILSSVTKGETYEN